VHAHDLVRLRLVAGDRVEALLDQFPDQLGPRRLVLDQHDIGIEGLGLLAYRALQFGTFHPLAQYVQQIEVLADDAQLVHTLKSLSSAALLAVSQL